MHRPTLVLSYSHEDRRIIRPMVQLMRATLQVREAVFWDEDCNRQEQSAICVLVLTRSCITPGAA